MLSDFDQNTQYRRKVLQVLLLITFFGGFVFGLSNIYRELYTLAFLELGYGLFSFLVWRQIGNTTNFQFWVISYLFPFFSIMMYALSVPGSSQSIFVWILTIPVISYLLLGKKIGFYFSIVFMTLGISIFHLKFMTDDIPLSITVSLNVILSGVLMIALAHVYERNREKNEERLMQLAGTDKLTGLANRMKLIDVYASASEYAKRHNVPLTIVLFDLDYFKKINDLYGHHVGDAALCFVADFLKKHTRKSDLLARFGGEEFALIMLASKPKDSFQQVDSLRKKLMNKPFIYNKKEINITLSAGISYLGVDGTDLDDLLVKADERLYFAKENGRNRVVADVLADNIEPSNSAK
ncbi:GGDEF domain-containing protein [Alteromonas sp. M12]|uniref:GGDEF domain-containing protein n=1 Tax=Alteromonas sp. M12 TaxID=3135644 RepID=UPI00319E5A20